MVVPILPTYTCPVDCSLDDVDLCQVASQGGTGLEIFTFGFLNFGKFSGTLEWI